MDIMLIILILVALGWALYGWGLCIISARSDRNSPRPPLELTQFSPDDEGHALSADDPELLRDAIEGRR